METLVKQDILTLIDKVVAALKKSDFFKLQELSNHVIHNASIFQDEDSVTMAVLIYALSKLFEHHQYISARPFIKLFDDARIDLVKENYRFYKQDITKLSRLISKFDSKYKKHIVEVINQAKLKKSSKIYEHGISLARAASMLGITQWELMNYIGKVEMPAKSRINALNRLNTARRIFQK